MFQRKLSKILALVICLSTVQTWRSLWAANAEVAVGDRVEVIESTPVYVDAVVRATAEPGNALVVTAADGDWIQVEMRHGGDTVRGWIHARHVVRTGGERGHDTRAVVAQLAQAFAQHEYLVVRLSPGANRKSVVLAVEGFGFEAWQRSDRPAVSWDAVIRSADGWRQVSGLLLQHAVHLWQGSRNADRSVPDRPAAAAGVALLFHMPRPHTLKLTDSLSIELSAATQEQLKVQEMSTYSASRYVVLVDEPHEHVDGQYALFKGLDSLVTDNPMLLQDRQLVFLSEGTPTGQTVQVQPLVDTAPDPTDAQVRGALETYLIPGYVAYAWKHPSPIRIEGIEEPALYRLCARLTYGFPDTASDAVLLRSHSVAARNASMVDSVLAQLDKYACPFLFVGTGHLASWRGDATVPEWRVEHLGTAVDTEDIELLRRNPERRGVRALLEERNVGYYVLTPRRAPIRNREQDALARARYIALLRAQVEGRVTQYVREWSDTTRAITTSPSPDDLADLLAETFLESLAEGLGNAMEEILEEFLELGLKGWIDSFEDDRDATH